MSPRLRPAASPDEAADLISAYVYGNILVLAAVVVLREGEIADGIGVAIVAGTAVSTFIAHVFAERLGAAAKGAQHHGWQTVLRDSRPILSSAAVPAALLAAGAWGWLEPVVCLRVAEAYLVVRLGLTAFIVSRLQGHPVTGRTWLASFGLAAAALVVVAVKVTLTH